MKSIKHTYLDSALYTALFVPLLFFFVRDLIAGMTSLLFEVIGGQGSFLYQINDDIARLLITGMLLVIMPLFFRGKCSFGLKGGKVKPGILLALPLLIAPAWNLLQVKVYDAAFVSGTAAVIAAVIHGIGPGVCEEIFCRGFVISNLMRIRKDQSDRILYSLLVSGICFGLLHAVNVAISGDVLTVLIQVIYTTAFGLLCGAVYLRSRNLWGVILMHTLTDITAFIAVFDTGASGMDMIFCVFGSLLFTGLSLYLVRPEKHAEIETLWEENWSFGDEDKKHHSTLKAAAVMIGVPVIIFILSLGIIFYIGSTGFITTYIPVSDNHLDPDVQYWINEEGKELTVALPYVEDGTYEVECSDMNAMVLKKTIEDQNFCYFVFTDEGNGTETIALTFSLESTSSDKTYTVKVNFDKNGMITAVRG